MRLRLGFIMTIAVLTANGQQLGFLDELFEYSITQLDAQRNAHNHSQVKWFQSDYGLSLGANYANQTDLNLENPNAGARVYLKFDALKNGLAQNKIEADKLEIEEQINKLENDEEILSINSAFYSNYIAYCYAEKKDKLLKEIIEKSNSMEVVYTTLYHDKAFDFSEVLKAQQIRSEYEVLLDLNSDLVELFSYAFDQEELPALEDFKAPGLHFTDLSSELRKWQLENNTVSLKKRAIQLNHNAKNLNKLSVSGGVDVFSGRPYVGVNFSSKLKRKNTETLRLEQSMEEENQMISMYLKQKSIRVLQAELELKNKKIQHLEYEEELIQEKLDLLRIKREILKLEEGITEKKLELELALIQFELMSLHEESYLDLKNIKSEIHPVQILPFLEDSEENEISKYPYEKYILSENQTELDSKDLLFIQRNELKQITDSMNIIGNFLIIDPAGFKSRSEMENYISFKHSQSPELSYLFLSLESLKELEVKSMAHNNREITFSVFEKLE